MEQRGHQRPWGSSPELTGPLKAFSSHSWRQEVTPRPHAGAGSSLAVPRHRNGFVPLGMALNGSSNRAAPATASRSTSAACALGSLLHPHLTPVSFVSLPLYADKKNNPKAILELLSPSSPSNKCSLCLPACISCSPREHERWTRHEGCIGKFKISISKLLMYLFLWKD